MARLSCGTVGSINPHDVGCRSRRIRTRDVANREHWLIDEGRLEGVLRYERAGIESLDVVVVTLDIATRRWLWLLEAFPVKAVWLGGGWSVVQIMTPRIPHDESTGTFSADASSANEQVWFALHWGGFSVLLTGTLEQTLGRN